MENLSVRFVFDRKKQATETKQGLLQIEVRVLKTSQKIFISTGIKIFKNQFSDKNGFACKNHPNASLINGKARRIFNQIEAFVFSDDCIDFSCVKNWNQDPSKTHSVVEFMRNELKKSDPSPATLEHHNILIRKIDEFGEIKTFSDITYANIIDFDLYLKKTIKTGSTLQKRHSTFRQYIRKAIYKDLCKKDPYEQFKMPSKKSKEPVYLIESEIKTLLDYKPTMERLIYIKDLFVFQLFTGMAFVDLMNFSKEYVLEVEGITVLKSNRRKTDESFISVLLNEAKQIAEKYNYNFPKISNQKYNDYLKLLGTGAQLKKNLTSHVARHSFATYLLNKNIPIETVSRAMGHSNIRMTQHYAKMLGKKVIEDMSVLSNTNLFLQ